MNENTVGATLIDVLNLYAPNQSQLSVAEILMKECPVIKDMVWQEANDVTQHVDAYRKSLPKSTREKFNQGITGEFGEEEQVTFGIQKRGNMPSIDSRLIAIASNPAEFIRIKVAGAIQGMTQEVETDLFYGSQAANTCDYDGIAQYTNAVDGERVIDAGGDDESENLTSAYVVAWDLAAGAYGIYPRGSKAGIQYEDKGKHLEMLSDGSRIENNVYYVSVAMGLATRDVRAFARLANIDVENIAANTFDEAKMIMLLDNMPSSLRAKAKIYVPTKLKTAIQLRINDKANVNFTVDNAFGTPVMRFIDVPVVRAEMISVHEDYVPVAA